MAITTSRSLLSVVVPAYNEEEVLPVFHERLAAVLDSLDIDGEIVYVNDGSSDKTMEVLQSIKAQDQRVAIVDLSRNLEKRSP